MILKPDLKLIFQTIMEYQMSYSLVPVSCFSIAMCRLPQPSVYIRSLPTWMSIDETFF